MPEQPFRSGIEHLTEPELSQEELGYLLYEAGIKPNDRDILLAGYTKAPLHHKQWLTYRLRRIVTYDKNDETQAALKEASRKNLLPDWETSQHYD